MRILIWRAELLNFNALQTLSSSECTDSHAELIMHFRVQQTRFYYGFAHLYTYQFDLITLFAFKLCLQFSRASFSYILARCFTVL